MNIFTYNSFSIGWSPPPKKTKKNKKTKQLSWEAAIMATKLQCVWGEYLVLTRCILICCESPVFSWTGLTNRRHATPQPLDSNPLLFNAPPTSIALVFATSLNLVLNWLKVRAQLTAHVLVQLTANFWWGVLITPVTPHDHARCTHIGCLSYCVVQVFLCVGKQMLINTTVYIMLFYIWVTRGNRKPTENLDCLTDIWFQPRVVITHSQVSVLQTQQHTTKWNETWIVTSVHVQKDKQQFPIFAKFSWIQR